MRRGVQMPPKAITRAAWTTAERLGAVIIVWTAAITVLSLVIIAWKVASWLMS